MYSYFSKVTFQKSNIKTLLFKKVISKKAHASKINDYVNIIVVLAGVSPF